MVRITDYHVQCTSCDELVEPEDADHRFMLGAIFGLGLGLIGLGVGATIGIATAGVGAPATIPLALLGLYLGWKLGTFIATYLDGVTCPACGSEFSGSKASTIVGMLPI